MKLDNKAIEAIAYSNWMSHCIGYGFPKHPEGKNWDCWELYEYFLTCEERDAYITHARDLRPKQKQHSSAFQQLVRVIRRWEHRLRRIYLHRNY